MFFGWFETEHERDTRLREEKKHLEWRMRNAVDWDPKIRWKKWLSIRADTYKQRSLFDVEPSGVQVNRAKRKQMKLSKCKRWCYVEKLLPRGEALATFHGPDSGDVVFDGDILIPALHERVRNPRDGERVEDLRWRDDPWMSMTPMEIISLRAGTRFAKGTVVVAGLGMGHQLEEVAKRKQVKHIILVEQDESLVEFILPVLDLGDRIIEVLIGDANDELPRLTADVALVDIYPGYGNNRFRRNCPNIKKIWVWGSACI